MRVRIPTFMPAELAALLRYARRMSDWEIKKDYEDCLVVVAGSEEDAEQLRAYGEARMKAPHFSPGKPGHNNHEFIKQVEVEVATVTSTSTDAGTGLCSLSETQSGLGACRARCSCGRATYVRQNGTWARHAPPKEKD